MFRPNLIPLPISNFNFKCLSTIGTGRGVHKTEMVDEAHKLCSFACLVFLELVYAALCKKLGRKRYSGGKTLKLSPRGFVSARESDLVVDKERGKTIMLHRNEHEKSVAHCFPVSCLELFTPEFHEGDNSILNSVREFLRASIRQTLMPNTNGNLKDRSPRENLHL